MRPTLLAAVLLLTPAAGLAQVERYELGRRLKRFEAEWEKVTDPAARKRALAILPKASTQFLSLNLTEAARTVDDAYWALKSADPPAAGVRWLDALCVVPEKWAVLLEVRKVGERGVVMSDPPFKVTVRKLYQVDGGPPAGTTARLLGPQTGEAAIPPDRLPVTVELSSDQAPLGSGTPVYDLPIRFQVRYGQVFEERRVPVSRFHVADPGKPDRSTIEGATAAAVHELARDLVAGTVPETDIPIQHWLNQKEFPERPFGGKRVMGGENGYWLVVPTGKDKLTPCRLATPWNMTKDKPVPLVVALHGAGGSENMFFESYGAGHIVKECQKRGWLLVSPRSGLLGTPPVAAIVDKLAERYPIDRKRVFLVGHSMGAGQAIDLVQRHPGTFAAVANLGGGGRVRQKERFETLPVFVGVGTADFALKSSRSLVKALADAGAKNVTAKEYPDLEHLLIVREALPDVFRMFDGL